jgi:hypothetical protein
MGGARPLAKEGKKFENGSLPKEETIPRSRGWSISILRGGAAGPISRAIRFDWSEWWPHIEWRRLEELSSRSDTFECKSSVSETAKNRSTSAQPIAVHSRNGSRRFALASGSQQLRQTVMAPAAIKTHKRLRNSSILGLQLEFYGTPMIQANLTSRNVLGDIGRNSLHLRVDSAVGSEQLAVARMVRLARKIGDHSAGFFYE